MEKLLHKLTISAGLVVLCLVSVWAMSVISAKQVSAAAECARVQRVGGQSMLINSCGQCRSIQVLKDRSGNALPSLRTFRLNAGEVFPLPFKGTGSVRIMSDANCREQTVMDRKREQKVADALQRCVFPMRTTGGIVLANGCDMCRAIIVERKYVDGRESHKSYALEAGSALALADEGAVSAEIIHDEMCGN